MPPFGGIAIGEGGGFNVRVAGTNFFTVQVAEKGVCWVRARATGEPGHGSMPREDSAVLQLSEAIARLGKRGLPRHASASVQEFIGDAGEYEELFRDKAKTVRAWMEEHKLVDLDGLSVREAAASLGHTVRD